MACHLSLTESQSYIARNNLDPDKRPGNDEVGRPAPTSRMEVNIRYQISLCAIFFASQLSVEFQGIYAILSLQYFGLPVSMVTLNGLISGLFSLVAIPVIGAYSDRGSNPKRRKVIVQIVSSTVLLLSCTLLTICSIVKANEEEPYEKRLNTSGLYPQPNDGKNVSSKTTAVSDYQGLDTSGESFSVRGIPFNAILGLLAFVAMDIGFDMSMSLPRGLIVECVPDHQKTQVFATGTSLAGLGGLVAGILGILNLPSFLGPIFNMDGVSAALILLCAFISLITLGSFGSTIITVVVLHFKNRNANIEAEVLIPKETTDLRKGYEKKTDETRLDQAHRDDCGADYGSIGEHIDTSVLTSKLKGCDNLSFKLSASSYNLNKNNTTPSESDRGNSNSSKCLQDDRNSFVETLYGSEDIRDENGNKIYSSLRNNMQDYHGDLTSLTTSATNSKALLDTEEVIQSTNASFMGIPLNRHFIITLISTFLTFGGLFSGTMYTSNALTLEVYKGDPHALPGSPARHLYEQGLQMASVGSLFVGAAYIITSLVNRMLLERINNAALLAFSSFALAVASTLFYFVPSLATYFLMMTSVGLFKCMAHIIPFILGLKYFKLEDMPNTELDETRKQTYAGRATSLVGTVLPLQSLILSAMGPLMEAAGNAWPPILYIMFLSTSNAFVAGLLLIV